MKNHQIKNRKITKKVGQLPGSLIYTGHKSVPSSKQHLIVFNESKSEFFENISFDEIVPKLEKDKTNWIHFSSLENISQIEFAGSYFDIHSLELEDILSSEHLPKIEYSEKHLFFTLKLLTVNGEKEVEQEHVSFILGNNYLLSFQELPGDLFGSIKERIINQKGKAHKTGADYLFYMLIDVIVDNYFLVMEKLREELDVIEDLLVEDPSQNHIHKIHDIKKKLVFIRKYISMLLESIKNLILEEPLQIRDQNLKYFGDIRDHVQYIYELLESYREDQRSLIELNQSNQSNSMNQVMKTLTIVASIFIPLTFIVGVYGMNFKYMPEIYWRWGYPTVIIVMLLVSIFMILYMKRKKWF